MAYPPAGLIATYGSSSDLSPRPGRLANIENALKAAVDDIVAILGSSPQGAFPTVMARLASLSAGTTGFKLSVRAATDPAVSYTHNTAFANGQVVDGVTLATGDRILVNTLNTTAGVYTVNASGAPTRSGDFASGADFPGMMVRVREGTKNAGRQYACTNNTAPTIGATAITFANATFRPGSYTISASDNPLGPTGADYACDGTADEFEFNLLFFFLALSSGVAKRARVELSAGTFTFSSPVAIAGINTGDAISFSGQGRQATLVTRSADTICFDLSGSGTFAHASSVGMFDMGFTGSTSPHTAPAVRCYYADHVAFDRVDWTSMTSVGLQGLEWWDSSLSRCRFDQVGTKGSGPRGSFNGGGAGSTGGNPSVLILGDIATTGFGHTNGSNCNALRFRDCTFESITDGAIQLHGNGTAEDFAGQLTSVHNAITVDGCKFESINGFGGFAPYVTAYRCNIIHVDDAQLAVGNAFTGFTTAQNLLNFDTCSGAWVGRAALVTVQLSNATRTAIRFNNCSGSGWDLLTAELTTLPTVALVEFAGANTLMARGRTIRYSGGNVTAVSGTPSTEYETWGTATIATGATFVDVTHRLVRTPTDGEVQLLPSSKPTNDPGHLWISNVGAATFRINATTAPTGSNLTIGWAARVRDN